MTFLITIFKVRQTIRLLIDDTSIVKIGFSRTGETKRCNTENTCDVLGIHIEDTFMEYLNTFKTTEEPEFKCKILQHKLQLLLFTQTITGYKFNLLGKKCILLIIPYVLFTRNPPRLKANSLKKSHSSFCLANHRNILFLPGFFSEEVTLSQGCLAANLTQGWLIVYSSNLSFTFGIFWIKYLQSFINQI